MGEVSGTNHDFKSIAHLRAEADLAAARDRVDTLFDAIKHGDADHREWLERAIAAHFAGEPVPAPTGKGNTEAMRDELQHAQAREARLREAGEAILEHCLVPAPGPHFRWDDRYYVASNQMQAALAERGDNPMVEVVEALRGIKANEGKVCEEFELCKHIACQSSYASWAIADEALASLDGSAEGKG